MNWFKLFSEWGSDPKIQAMPEHMRCRHVMLLCLRSTTETTTVSEEELAFYFRISMEELAETKALFICKGFIDKRWNVLKWNTRQSTVTDSAKRMRKMRQQELSLLRNSDSESDVTVTSHGETVTSHVAQQCCSPPFSPPHTPPLNTPPEIEQKDPPLNPPPRGESSSFVPPNWIPQDDWDAWLEMRKQNRIKTTSRAMKIALNKLNKLRLAGQDVSAILQEAVLRNWTGIWEIGDSRKPFSKSPNGKYPEGSPPYHQLAPEVTPAQQAAADKMIADGMRAVEEARLKRMKEKSS